MSCSLQDLLFLSWKKERCWDCVKEDLRDGEWQGGRLPGDYRRAGLAPVPSGSTRSQLESGSSRQLLSRLPNRSRRERRGCRRFCREPLQQLGLDQRGAGSGAAAPEIFLLLWGADIRWCKLRWRKPLVSQSLWLSCRSWVRELSSSWDKH